MAQQKTDWGSALLYLVGAFIVIGVIKLLGGGPYKMPSNSGYNNSKPVNMSREEWNTIGNIAVENDYSEEEAQQLGDAISRFKGQQ